MSEPDLALRGRRVLLVEDEPGLREALGLTLEIEGFAVTLASNGREALASLSSCRVDLVVTDYMMPRMNGSELIRELRMDPTYADVPILLMSAALPHHVSASIANAFLQKPVGMAQLLQTVTNLLKR